MRTIYACALISSCVSATSLPDQIVGYYSWNWGTGSPGPSGANVGCAFTGLIDVDKAIAQYSTDASWCCPKLHGFKMLTLGGGNSAGLFNQATLAAITQKAAAIKAAGYQGVMYDVEEVDGPSSTMIPLFQASFAAMKEAGIAVGVTTSHSAPYQCDTPEDAVAFVKSWCADANVDVISPQLYSSGQEAAPELVPTNSCKDAGCTWDLYTACKARIVPSVVESSHYEASKQFFATTVKRDTSGYFEWKQRKTLDMSISTPREAAAFEPCVITGCPDGCDIADIYNDYPNPFAFYTDPAIPGVTLPGPDRGSHCGWKVGTNFTWDKSSEQCILNGQGYPLSGSKACSNDKYNKDGKEHFVETVKSWYDYAMNVAAKKTVPGATWETAHVATVTVDGEQVEAAMSMGHGVLDGYCGDCFLVRRGSRYILQLQTDVRAWSLELSPGAALWLSPGNMGGTCDIPEVRPFDCASLVRSNVSNVVV